jgi:hypothetical protein
MGGGASEGNAAAEQSIIARMAFLIINPLKPATGALISEGLR